MSRWARVRTTHARPQSACSRYDTVQEVRRSALRGRSLGPDGVVLVFCLNDFDVFSYELPLLNSTAELSLSGGQRPAAAF